MLKTFVASYHLFPIFKPSKSGLKIEVQIIRPLPYALCPKPQTLCPHALCAMPYAFTSPFRI
ncbi:MAG: hypothetical protein PVI42_14750, partial [Desulfobacterales bacterium]